MTDCFSFERVCVCVYCVVCRPSSGQVQCWGSASVSVFSSSFPDGSCLVSLAQRDKCVVGLVPGEQLRVPPVYHFSSTDRAELLGRRASLYHLRKVSSRAEKKL